MSTKLPSVDVLLVGFGWTGAILAQELTDSDLEVLALERGPWQDTPTDFPVSFVQDELRYSYRHAQFQDLSHDTLTFRNTLTETALPMRKLGSFLLGTGTGGSGGAAPTWTTIYTKFISNAQYASNCNGSNCHNPGKQKGYDFSTQANGYASVKSNTSQFVSVLSSGSMPQGKTKMPAADLAIVKAWVAAGAQNN